MPRFWWFDLVDKNANHYKLSSSNIHVQQVKLLMVAKISIRWLLTNSIVLTWLSFQIVTEPSQQFVWDLAIIFTSISSHRYLDPC